MGYSYVTIRTRREERIERIAHAFEFDVLWESDEQPTDGLLQLHGIIPDEQIDRVREEGLDIRVLRRSATV